MWLSAINQQHQTLNNFYYQVFHSLAVCTTLHRCSLPQMHMLFCKLFFFSYVLNIVRIIIYQSFLVFGSFSALFIGGFGQWASMCVFCMGLLFISFVISFSNFFLLRFFFLYYKYVLISVMFFVEYHLLFPVGICVYWS